MAAAHQDNVNGNRRTNRMLFNQIYNLVQRGSLQEIKEIFENLHPEQCTMILSFTSNTYNLLSWAVHLLKIDISHYLLEISLRQGCYQMCESWKKAFHPLSAAFNAGNCELIELISKNLYDINDFISCTFTPLKMAIFTGKIEFVRLLVDLGADINAHLFNGISPLMSSTSNSDICQFLLENGANVNYQDRNGFTALHEAVVGMHFESLKILVDGGADVHIKNDQGMVPLMLAAANSNSFYMIHLIDISDNTILNTIESLEILNSCFVIDEHLIINGWIHCLLMRGNIYLKSSPYPAQEILDFSEEFKTSEELEEIETNPLKLAFQAILVIERILGRDTHLYIQTFLKTAIIARRENELNKFQQLVDYCCEYYQNKTAKFFAASSPLFMALFSEFFNNGDLDIFLENSAYALFKMVAQKTEELWLHIKESLLDTRYYEHSDYFNTIDMFLYMVSFLKKASFPHHNLLEYYKVIHALLKSDPRTVVKQSLLHRVIRLSQVEDWCSLKLIQVLVECGADTNSKDVLRRTPLMYALEYTPYHALREVLGYLIETGSHVDCKDSEGISAMDVTRFRCRGIKPKSPRTLQCLATEVILDNGIPYEEEVSEVLKEFVDMHK